MRIEEVGRRKTCLRSVRLSGLFCMAVRMLEIIKEERKGRQPLGPEGAFGVWDRG